MGKELTSIKGFLKFKTMTALNPRKSIIVKKDNQNRGWWFCHYGEDDMILVEWDLLDSFCEWSNVVPRFCDNTTACFCGWSNIELY